MLVLRKHTTKLPNRNNGIFFSLTGSDGILLLYQNKAYEMGEDWGDKEKIPFASHKGAMSFQRALAVFAKKHATIKEAKLLLHIPYRAIDKEKYQLENNAAMLVPEPKDKANNDTIALSNLSYTIAHSVEMLGFYAETYFRYPNSPIVSIYGKDGVVFSTPRGLKNFMRHLNRIITRKHLQEMAEENSFDPLPDDIKSKLAAFQRKAYKQVGNRLFAYKRKGEELC